MTRDAKLKIVQGVPFLASLALMLIPAYRAHAAGLPEVTSTKNCYFFRQYAYSGGVLQCWGGPPPTSCVVCG